MASANARAVVLHENESARVKSGDGNDRPTILVDRAAANPNVFVRQLASQSKYVDLLDIVAGGDGMGRRRERGIDPTSGMEDPTFMTGLRYGDGKYHHSTTFQLIDGAFVFSGNRGPVQLDSAGDTFDGFPITMGQTWGSIWARGAVVRPRGRGLEGPGYWI